MATRELTSHRVNGLNEHLTIAVKDGPGPGNANHEYEIVYIKRSPAGVQTPVSVPISFQNGPINEVGVTGLSNEALLAIVEDRLVGFQGGQYACRENALALTHLQESLMWLQKRTRDRMARGVEGTSTV